jgi:tetratricopeptide (TPR) repeat protein
LTRRALASVLNALGMLRSEQGRRAEAITATEEAETLMAQLHAQQPDVVDYRRSLTTIWTALASLYRLDGKPKKSLEVAEKAVAVNRKTLAADPQNASAQRDLVVALGNVMAALNGAQDFTRSLQVEVEVMAMLHALHESDADNLQTVNDMLWVLTSGARASLETGALTDAERKLREVLALVARHVGSDLTDSPLAEENYGAHASLAEVYERLKRHDEAIAEAQLAIDGFELMLKGNPELKRLANRAAIVIETQARLRMQRADTLRGPAAQQAMAEACAELKEARDRFAALIAEGADTGSIADDRAEAETLAERCVTPR